MKAQIKETEETRQKLRRIYMYCSSKAKAVGGEWPENADALEIAIHHLGEKLAELEYIAANHMEEVRIQKAAEILKEVLSGERVITIDEEEEGTREAEARKALQIAVAVLERGKAAMIYKEDCPLCGVIRKAAQMDIQLTEKQAEELERRWDGKVYVKNLTLNNCPNCGKKIRYEE